MNDNMPVLSIQDVHVWSAHKPPTLPPEFFERLSQAERARANSLRFLEHHLAYVFAHAMLRDVLSRYLHCRPEDVCLLENPFGKPSVSKAWVDTTLEFSMSHAGDLTIVALCHGRRIGIDAEEVRPIADLLSIANSHFTPEECEFLRRQLPSNREREFLRCWTRKEAYVKALGAGLSIPLNSFDSLVSRESSTVILKNVSNLTDAGLWLVTTFDLHEGYVTSVAVEAYMAGLVHFDWRTGTRNQLKAGG